MSSLREAFRGINSEFFDQDQEKRIIHITKQYDSPEEIIDLNASLKIPKMTD